MIAIVDYKAGNIGSIKNMLKKIGHDSVISSDPEAIRKADKIILPGVGSFDYGIRNLTSLNIVETLNEKRAAGTPILGICLGAQLMCNASEEGKGSGLGWINGEVKRFANYVHERKYRVPHMGWDNVKPSKDSRLFHQMPDNPRFYFVHSFYIKCHDRADALIENAYGNQFDAAFERQNVIGVQFHPEKSHKFGQQLLKNFIECY